jgi:hypothetical protein
MKAEVAIVVGFDRSGTSAISRAAATHPKVELLWRSFNSGSMRQKMNVILDDDSASDADRYFFQELEQGRLDTSYIKTPYHWKTSTVKEDLIPGHLHFLITNINHFSTPWAQAKYPGILHWAIWRDPFNILQSCVENDFLNEWYSSVIPEIKLAILGHPFLAEQLEWSHEMLSNNVRKTAYILAAKNLLLFHTVPNERIIDYEVFKENAGLGLKPILEHYLLDTSFSFSKIAAADLNTIPGKVPFEKGKKKKLDFEKNDFEFLNRILYPLYKEASITFIGLQV